MNTKSIVVGVVVLVLLVLGVTFPKSGGTVVERIVGASTGPDSFFPQETHNGIAKDFVNVGFQVASSTVCSVQGPARDFKLAHAGIRFVSLPSFATNFMLGSGTKNATTTSIIAVAQMAYGASAANQTVFASSTSAVLIPANTWINLNYSTSTGATITAANFPITGKCQFEFVEI